MPKRRVYHSSSGRGNNDHERRICALEGKVDLMNGTVEQVKTDTAEILALLTHAKSFTGFVRKHSPKAATFLIGVAIARGWISAENGQNFLHLLGF